MPRKLNARVDPVHCSQSAPIAPLRSQEYQQVEAHDRGRQRHGQVEERLQEGLPAEAAIGEKTRQRGGDNQEDDRADEGQFHRQVKREPIHLPVPVFPFDFFRLG